MLIKRPPDIRPSELTRRSDFLNRRRFIGAAAAAAALAHPAGLIAMSRSPSPPPRGEKLGDLVKSEYSTTETPNSFEDVTTHNNFYEFGTGKSDPARESSDFKPRPWTVRVKGECAKPGDYPLEDLLSPHALEERIYRMRCVEAWSMVIPWVGIPLGPMLERFGPTANAKYVGFRTVLRPGEMPGQQLSFMDWPYAEGLRIDEAMHPLTLLAVGIFGEVLPNQNGAPMRLVVPWKYGFKSIKSIDTIEFTEKEPPTSWNVSAPHEYGFYANVNPAVKHPRWSQKRERRIGELSKRDTLPFNGYGEQVASLYAGMDLTKQY